MAKHSKSFEMSRRAALAGLATASGGVILQSLATGIPASVLLNPLSANADTTGTGPARTLIMSCSRYGDPFNGNVPGMYNIPGVNAGLQPAHPLDAGMVATNLTLNGTATRAAKPWADLPQATLDKTAFFHHATYTPVHGEMPRVHRMMDATEKSDMLISLIGRETAQTLGSVQSEPVSLGATTGGELLSSQGRILGNVACVAVKAALGGVEGPLKSLTAMRDKHIDKIYALYKKSGTPSQRRMLDAWARSRDEVRAISQDLISRLDTITGNDQVNQLRCAAVLAAMNITSVITVHLDFGRDNHTDNNLQNEANQHMTAIPLLQDLQTELDVMKTQGVLQQEVVVASLNVFGRTIIRKGTTGRDHNSGHHCMMVMGDGVQGGIVGGVELNAPQTEYLARPINSTTGAADDAGDIIFEETLGSAGKTLGCLLGVSEERMDQIIPAGKPVTSIIA